MKTKKHLTILEYELPVEINEEREGGFFAKCSVWQDCYAQGDTIEEVINEISYVASSLIELYKEEGLRLPLKLKAKSDKTAPIKLTFPLIISAT